MTEREKMLAGLEFDSRDPELIAMHHQTRATLSAYNATESTAIDERFEILHELLDTVGPGTWIEPRFFCDYGQNIRLGSGVFVNAGCVFLDGNQITIGDGTLLGPSVHIYTASHPIDPDRRVFLRDGVPSYRSSTQPVVIGRKVWIGGGAILLPGVSIGDGTTIGAGSVVTKSLPERVFAAGNPCRVIRQL